MAKTKQGDTVKVHYTGKLEGGKVFDSSLDKAPLEFTLGKEQVLKGFEEAVVGMEPGESKTTKLKAEQAYGPNRQELVVDVPRDQLPEHIKPEVGQRLEVQQQDGQKMPVAVTKVSPEHVTLDANHPLAGENLIFDIQLVEIV